MTTRSLETLLDVVRQSDREDRDLRDWCLSVLSGAGRSPPDLLARLLEDKRPNVRLLGLEAATRSLGAHPEVLSAIRLQAAGALGRLGPAASAAFPRLESMARDSGESPALREAAAEAAKNIKG